MCLCVLVRVLCALCVMCLAIYDSSNIHLFFFYKVMRFFSSSHKVDIYVSQKSNVLTSNEHHKHK